MQRIFNLSGNRLTMGSFFDDEFGDLHLVTIGDLELCEIKQFSEPLDSRISMDMRIAEMSHFLRILKLFDPNVNSRIDYGLPQIVSQTPPEPWETE